MPRLSSPSAAARIGAYAIVQACQTVGYFWPGRAEADISSCLKCTDMFAAKTAPMLVLDVINRADSRGAACERRWNPAVT